MPLTTDYNYIWDVLYDGDTVWFYPSSSILYSIAGSTVNKVQEKSVFSFDKSVLHPIEYLFGAMCAYMACIACHTCMYIVHCTLYIVLYTYIHTSSKQDRQQICVERGIWSPNWFHSMLRQLNGTQGMAFETCDFFIISGVGKKKLINALIQLITLDIQGHTLQCIVMHQVFQKGENNQSHYQSLANFLLKQILTLLCTAQNFLLLKCGLLRHKLCFV